MKRLITTVICTLLIATMLCACAPGTTTTGTTTGGTTKATTTGATTATTTTVSDEPTTVSFFGVDVRAIEGVFLKDNLWVWEELGKRLNQTYVFNCNNGYHDIVNLRLYSGEKLEDLFCIGYNDPQKPSAEGIFLPLEELIDQYGPNIKKMMGENPNFKLANTSLADGKMYTFSESTFKCKENDVILYYARKDWFDKLNLKAPETIDELFDVLLAIKKGDPNNNGKDDELPLVADAFQDIAGLLGQSFGLHMHRNNSVWAENGKVYMEITTDNYKNMLMFYNKLYENELVPADIQNYTWEIASEMTAKNVVGVSLALYGNVGAAGVDPENPESRPMGFIAPAGADGKRTIEESFTEFKRYAITKDCENPAAVMKLLDYLYSEEGYRLYNFGIEGEDYTIIDGQPAPTDKFVKSEIGMSAEYEKRGMQIQIVPRIYVPLSPVVLAARDPNVQEPWQRMYDHLVPGIYVNKLPKTEAESTAINNEDLKTYISTTVVEFVLGTRSFDKWDDFQAQLLANGIDKVTEAYQAIYDRNYK